ncbi:MAG TPA: hypothetical protein PKO06_20030, partial [Candidatus Ozemobacteraceae bacterium]|nr:hypothetical protein [Candidatus Ozemobacteraceae bacterium]
PDDNMNRTPVLTNTLPASISLPLLLVMVLLCVKPAMASVFKFDGKYHAKSTIDSTRKDYAEVLYPDYTGVGVTSPLAYDKTFVAYVSDMQLKLKGDLTPTQYLDFAETLHYQFYEPQDYKAYSLDSYKYRYVDHYFNMTYGIMLGTADAFKFDFINNIYRIPIDNYWDFTSNLGKVRFNHKVNVNTSLAFEAQYEERDYPNDASSDYQEGAVLVDFSTFLPEVLRYRPVGNSTRGEREPFQKTPTGMTTRKAVDYYTTWTKKPGQSEPEAKYLADVVRGDLALTLIGDLRSRNRTTLNNAYYQPSGILRGVYDASDKLKINFENTYYNRSYDRESDAYFLYDYSSNRFYLSGTHRPDTRFTYIMSWTNEFYDHDRVKEQDYHLNIFQLETYYTYGRSNASLVLKDTLTRYKYPRLYYADADLVQIIFGYDYPITKRFLFHFKDEWVDNDQKNNEDLLYSSYVRNTWRVALEKILSQVYSLEVGYQNKRERHEVFTANNITEKTLFFSLLSKY